jgi:hypothetical protein
MSTRNLPGGKGQPARNADNLIAIREQTWKPQHLTTLCTSVACYRVSFTFFIIDILYIVLYRRVYPQLHIQRNAILYLHISQNRLFAQYPYETTSRPNLLGPEIDKSSRLLRLGAATLFLQITIPHVIDLK